MKLYHIHVLNVDYAIEPDDLPDCKSDDEFEKERNEILKDLPQEMELDIEAENQDELDDLVCDEVSNITNWLNYNVTYGITNILDLDD